MVNFLSPQQLADLCKTTKRTVLYYNSQQLLKPAQTDRRGERLYRTDQKHQLDLLLILSKAGIPLEAIRSDLASLDGSYKKVYSKYASAVQAYVNSTLSSKRSIEDYFGAKSFPLTKNPPIFIAPKETLQRSTYMYPNEVFFYIDELKMHFNHQEDPLPYNRFAIIPLLTRTCLKPLITIGINIEARITPYKKYAQLYSERNTTGQKAYSHTRLQSKNYEVEFLNSTINKAHVMTPNAKALKLIFSNRREKYTKYLLETQLLL